MAKTYSAIKTVSDQIKNATTAASNTAAIVGGNLGDIVDKIQEVAGAKVDKEAGSSLMTSTEKTKLAGLNNYTHPVSHPPSIIVQDANSRFVSDAEKATYLDKYTKNEVDNKLSTLVTGLDWKEAVTTFADIATTYPTPDDGWSVYVKSEDITYTNNGTAWVTSSQGDIPLATTTTAGKMSAADKTKLDGIAAGATVNDTDSNLKNRANHTGTQSAGTISDFAATVRTTVLTGLSLLTNSAIAVTDSVLTALGKLQKQITDHFNATNPHGITKTTVGLGSVDNTADINKSVASAAKLTTARKINGVDFDGSLDITISDGSKEPSITIGTTSQYYRGDKTWQTLNKAAVGLNNVDNTSDTDKPISSATQTALNAKAATSHTHSPSDLSSPVTIAKGGTGLNALGTAGQFLQVNSAANAMEWVTPRDKGANTVSTLASLPVTKRLVVANVTAATTLSLAANMEIGDELHVIVYNNSSTAKTQPLPNTGAFLSLSGTGISIPAYGYIEINILCSAVNNYIIRAL